MIAFNSEKIKNIIEKKIHHPYLERYIRKPWIDLDKVDMLSMIYNDVPMIERDKQAHIISIMLVQIALDTHDLVTNESRTMTDEIERQLFVLAGDYYSGLYYKTLAEIEDNELVQVLAKAIKLINEQKLPLYQFELSKWDELIQTLKAIESTLITNVAAMHKLSDVDLEYISEFLLINRLLREKEAIQYGNFSYLDEYIRKGLVDRPLTSLTCFIEEIIEKSQKRMKQLQNKTTYSYKNLDDKMDDKAMLSAVEEG